jgi:hypothetical protein
MALTDHPVEKTKVKTLLAGNKRFLSNFHLAKIFELRVFQTLPFFGKQMTLQGRSQKVLER